MTELSYEEKVRRLVKNLSMNVYKPDIHSFLAVVKDGTVFVEALEHDYISICCLPILSPPDSWEGTVEEMAKKLVEFGLDLDTVEM